MQINEDYLLVLIRDCAELSLTQVKIVDSFSRKGKELRALCSKSDDNIDDLILFLNELKNNLPEKEYRYCPKKSWLSLPICVNTTKYAEIIKEKRNELYLKKTKSEGSGKADFDFDQEIKNLKRAIELKTTLWFKAINIEKAYEKANELPNMLAHSHRIRGWKTFKHNVTGDLTQEIKTNFGYGNSSYFFLLLTYKGIQITPFSEWIRYEKASFTQIIRYTKSFKSWEYETYKDESDGKEVVGETYSKQVSDECWSEALSFTIESAMLLLNDVDAFLNKYIYSECEEMLNGLESIYNSAVNMQHCHDEIEVDIEPEFNVNRAKTMVYNVEKIIGALDFVAKIIECEDLIPTEQYVKRIILLNNNFFPYARGISNILSKEQALLLLKYEKFKDIYDKELKKNEDHAFNNKLNGLLQRLLHEKERYDYLIKFYSESTKKVDQYIAKYHEFKCSSSDLI